MQVEKIYKHLTTKEYGVHKGTTVDGTDGKIKHTMEVNGEPREVADSTFRRWWKWVEDVTPEELDEALELFHKAEDKVGTKQPTVQDLIQLNELGIELTEEELQVFEGQCQQTESASDEPIIHELPVVDLTKKEEEQQPDEAPQEQVEQVQEQPKEKKVNGRKSEPPETAAYFLSRVVENGGEWHVYTEGREGVVKSGGKAVLFFGFVRNGIRIHMKEQLDEAVIKCPYPVEEKHTYPKQFPFRFVVPEINDESKQLIEQILKLHI